MDGGSGGFLRGCGEMVKNSGCGCGSSDGWWWIWFFYGRVADRSYELYNIAWMGGSSDGYAKKQ